MEVAKLEDLPLHFYKYRSLVGDQKDFTKQIILDSSLYWSNPLSFNDPFECAPVPEMPKDALEREFSLKRLIRDHDPKATKSIRRAMLDKAMRIPPEAYERELSAKLPEFFKEWAVCSLSATGENVLMWSHYADAHNGLCLRFHPLQRKSSAPYVPEKTYFELAFPIKYSADRPTVRIPTVDPDETLERTILTKADFWDYEEEWRLFSHTGGAGRRAFPPECLDAVILGARMPQEVREEVRGWCAARGAPVTVLEASFDNRRFRLNIE